MKCETQEYDEVIILIIYNIITHTISILRSFIELEMKIYCRSI